MRITGRMVINLLLFVVAFAGINTYIGWNIYLFLTQYFEAVSPLWLGLIMTIVALGYGIGRIKWLGHAGRFIKVLGSFYFALLEFFIIVLPIADIAGWISHLAGVESAVYIPVIGWLVVGLLVLFLVAGSYNAWSPIVRQHEISIHKKKPGGQPGTYRIAVASDIHLGNIVGNRHLGRLVSIMNEMKPDLILLAGDVLDDSIEPFLRNKMSEGMKKLKAKHGVYAVLGNHEYYGGHVDQYVEEMGLLGIRVLQDETVTTAGGALQIAGRKDLTAEKTDPKKRLPVADLLEPLNHEQPIILLDHQPYAFEKAAEAGADLLLCGHTHRGQFAPNHWITKRLFELDWGYMLKDKMHVIVSSGFGSWGPPIRIASRSEIIQIELKLEG
ncbi:phosphoesterase [Paenibacillus sp. FSL H7-0326]|uniref:metallophosphoesterase n=2 Tax=Paenibacillus sp. FSL H7-0326 TaxID=1921144 RepID=UPI00096E6D5A|nr:metallophosphoesterase [Paenibacillus sp. FSL H7-0326]OMC65367.1 phosphoesterase [Paenibacillus sp. FSL H7-0326]